MFLPPGNRFIRKAMLDPGAEIDARNENNQTPLIVAAKYGRNDFTAMLIEAGADVSAADNYEKTAMVYAAEEGYTEIVEQLLLAGAEN